jgi:hypothetical protein
MARKGGGVVFVNSGLTKSRSGRTRGDGGAGEGGESASRGCESWRGEGGGNGLEDGAPSDASLINSSCPSATEPPPSPCSIEGAGVFFLSASSHPGLSSAASPPALGAATLDRREVES